MITVHSQPVLCKEETKNGRDKIGTTEKEEI